MGSDSRLFRKKSKKKTTAKKKNKRVVFVHGSAFFEALKQTLPKKSVWSIEEVEDVSQIDFTEEDFDMVVYAYPKPQVSLSEETAKEYVEDRIFALLELLETLQATPPKQFVFISSWRAGDPDSILGAIYRNGEVLVEGFASHAGIISKSLRRMKPTEESLENSDQWKSDVATLLLEWMEEKTPSGTYEMHIKGEEPALSIERVEGDTTDFVIAKKIMSNMKEHFSSGRIMDGLAYLRQLHTQKKY